MAFIGIVKSDSRPDAELDAYRFGTVGMTLIEGKSWRSDTSVVVWIATDMRTAEGQADRLSTGLYGAKALADYDSLGEWLQTVLADDELARQDIRQITGQ